MKINIEPKEVIQANFIIDAIENEFEAKASLYNKLTYSSEYKISKRTFNAYEFDEMISKDSLFSIAGMLIKNMQELRIKKNIYKTNLLIQKEYYKTNGMIEHRDCLSEIEFVNTVYKFIKPIIVVKLEKDLKHTNFISKCTWLDEFKQEFKPLLKLFKNPI
jgi:hypothetical protein